MYGLVNKMNDWVRLVRLRCTGHNTDLTDIPEHPKPGGRVSASPMIRDFQQTTVASIGLLAQAKTALWGSSQLRRRASSAIAMFPGLSHSSLAYYGAVLLQRHRPPRLLLLLTDRRRHLPTLTATWHLSHRRFAPSRTRPSPKAAVSYVCGEGANVESLAHQPCVHSI